MWATACEELESKSVFYCEFSPETLCDFTAKSPLLYSNGQHCEIVGEKALSRDVVRLFVRFRGRATVLAQL